MEAFALRPALAALALALALELAYLLYRRHFDRAMERLRFQLFTVAWTLTAYFALTGGAAVPGWLPRFVAFVTAYATVDLGFHLLDRFALSRLHDSRGRVAIPQLVRDLAGWVLLVGTVLAAGARFLGWQLGSWALPSAVVSAVLGFALQDVLKNVFAGLALQTEAPFDTGDWLMVDGEARQVIEMTWRSTHLRNSIGVDFHEPNANLSAARITNLGSGIVAMGFEMRVPVHYGAPPGPVKAALEQAARACAMVVANPAPQGLVDSFGESGVVYRLRFWSREVQAVTRLFDEVQSHVWYQLRREGWALSFPIRAVELAGVQELAADRRSASASRAAGLFAKVELLAALPETAQRRLAEVARHQYFDAGERLVVEGEHGDSLMVLARGAVTVSKSGAEIGDATVELAHLNEGDYFGELSLLTGAPRSATITAREPVELFVLDRAALAPLLHEDPKLAETLSRVLAERAAATVARFEDRKDQLRRSTMPEQHTLLAKIRDFFRLG
jgi:small-conductance mechanosensitive channel